MSKHTYANRGLWRLEITLNGLWWYGQIGVHQERCHSSSREVPFSTDFCELAVSEMNFWLSQLVLENYKKNGVMPKFAIKCSQSRLTWGSQPTNITQHHCLPGWALFWSRNEHWRSRHFPSQIKLMSLQETVHTWCIERIPPNQTWEGFLAGLYIPQFADTQILAIISAVPIPIHSWLYQLVYACASCASRGARGKFEMAKLEALSRRAVLFSAYPVHGSASEVNHSSVDAQVVSCHRYLVVFHPFVEQLANLRLSYMWTRSAVVFYLSSHRSTSIWHHKQHVPKRYVNYA